jgi:hypothetical protein
MANHALASVSRNDRRILLRNEERRRKSGDWGPWERIDLPMGIPGTGWCNLIRYAYRNAVFSVLVRTVEDGVRHFAVSSLTGVRPTWWEMQRIKNELAGDAATAVEVYPPQAEVIDGADMFHIWVMPTALPFSLWKDEVL